MDVDKFGALYNTSVDIPHQETVQSIVRQTTKHTAELVEALLTGSPSEESKLDSTTGVQQCSCRHGELHVFAGGNLLVAEMQAI